VGEKERLSRAAAGLQRKLEAWRTLALTASGAALISILVETVGISKVLVIFPNQIRIDVDDLMTIGLLNEIIARDFCKYEAGVFDLLISLPA
jgi:hypothetical protein